MGTRFYEKSGDGRFEADCRWPVPALQMVNREARGVRDRLRVVVFNANGGRRCKEILECLRQPPLAEADIILLCDVDSLQERSGFVTVAAKIAAALRMSFAYVPKYKIDCSSNVPTSRGGTAILSSQPLDHALVIPLPSIENHAARIISKRYGIVASAAFNHRVILLGVVHLTVDSSPAKRRQQMEDFINALPAKVPAVIGGDFNTTTIDFGRRGARIAAAIAMLFNSRRFRAPEKHEPLFEVLREAGFEPDRVNKPFRPTFTYTSAIPRFLRPKLDWIAVRGLSPVPGSALVVPGRRGVFNRRISDHDFVTCQVRL